MMKGSEENNSMFDLASLPKGAMLSEKEIEILRFVNEFGFCEIQQIMKRFAMKKSPAYLKMQMLIRLGLVIQARVIQGRRGSYCVTHKGISLLQLDLPLVKKISLGIYDHHLLVIDVHLKFRELHPDTVWVTERRLIRNQYENGFRKNEHLPDGVLIFPDSNQYAIEIERSLKTKARLEEILLGYGLQRTFKEVWYFCSQEVFSLLNKVTNNMPYVKTYNLKEFLQ